MLCFPIYFVLLIHIIQSKAHLKLWNHYNDVNYKENWVGKDYSKDCNDLVLFPMRTDAVMSIFYLEVKEVVLPSFGEIILRDTAMIEFKPNTGKCEFSSLFI